MQDSVTTTLRLVRDELPPPFTLDERDELAAQVLSVTLALSLRVRRLLAQGKDPRLFPFYGPGTPVGLAWFEQGFVVHPGEPGRVEDLATAIVHLSTTSPEFRRALRQLAHLRAVNGALPTHTLAMGRVLVHLRRLIRQQPTIPRTAAMLRRKQELEAALRTFEAQGHFGG